MKNFENISENVMVVIAASCSKTLTSYGMRCGAAVLVAKAGIAMVQTSTIIRQPSVIILASLFFFMEPPIPKHAHSKPGTAAVLR